MNGQEPQLISSLGHGSRSLKQFKTGGKVPACKAACSCPKQWWQNRGRGPCTLSSEHTVQSGPLNGVYGHPPTGLRWKDMGWGGVAEAAGDGITGVGLSLQRDKKGRAFSVLTHLLTHLPHRAATHLCC
jgi:hypothetical protein